MIYLTNFFARKIEAVSKQVEDSRLSKKDPIVTCCYFLNQKPLRLADIKDNIWIFPKWLYPIVAFLLLTFSKAPVHIFEDEASAWRRISLNFRKRKVFVSLFKDINLSLVNHLNSLNNLRSVIVEDKESLEFVKKNLSGKRIPVILKYPPSLWVPQRSSTPREVNLLFASWNGGDKNTLIERGIYDLLNLVKDTAAICTIILRDHDTKDLLKLIDHLGITKKVRVVFPENITQLQNEFEKSQYVVIIPRSPIMKYVPNSIIDGLSLGKPCIISGDLRFAETVKTEKLGILFNYKNQNKFRFPSKNDYKEMSHKCLNWAILNIKHPYSESLGEIYNTN